MAEQNNVTNSEGGAAEQKAPIKLNIQRTVLVGLAFFTVGIFWQIYDSIMPLFLANFDLDWTLIGLVMAADNVLALVLLPTMGRLSDRTKSRFGRRMPFIVVGSALAATTFLLVNFAHNQQILWVLMISTTFLLLFMCLYRTPAVALMPDVTPKVVRSKANAIINIMGTIGGIIALVLMMVLLKSENKLVNGVVQINDFNMPIKVVSTGNWALIIITAILMISAAVVMIFTVKENELVAKKQKELEEAGLNEDENETAPKVKGTGLSKAELKSLILILASVFLWFMGYNAATTYFSTFSYNFLGEENFSLPMMIAYGAAFIMYIPASMIGSKIGRRKTILIGIVLVGAGFALGALIAALVTDVAVVKFIMYPVFVLVGAGWATINVHSFVMSVELAKKGNTGLFTGLYYTFSMGAQALTPIFVSVFLHISFKLLFVYSAVFVLLSFVTMFFVKHGNAKAADERSALEKLSVDD